MSGMLVKCTTCGREERPDHGRAIKQGWPVCCGYTMRLESTREFIAAVERGGIPHLAEARPSPAKATTNKPGAQRPNQEV